jgi:hypothetical protein
MAREFAQRFCEYCGQELQLAAPGAAPVLADAQVLARLVAIERSAEFERLAEHTPRKRSQILPIVGLLVFLAFWLIIGSLVSAAFAAVGGPLVLFPVAVLGFGVVMILRQFAKRMRTSQAELERPAAQVVDKSTQVDGSDSGTTTSYFVTLARRDGERREYSAESDTYAALAAGDAGMAFVQAEHLLEFRRIEF